MRLKNLLIEYVDKDVPQMTSEEKTFVNYYGERNCYYFEFAPKEVLKKAFHELWGGEDDDEYLEASLQSCEKLFGKKLLGAIVYEEDFDPSIVLFDFKSDIGWDGDTQFSSKCFKTKSQMNRELTIKNSKYPIGTTFDFFLEGICYIGDIYCHANDGGTMYKTFQKDSNEGVYPINEIDFIKLVEKGKIKILTE